jgi:hypothetical protein
MEQLSTVLALEVVFGIVYALFLYFTDVGKLLDRKLTFLSVMIGVTVTVMLDIERLGDETVLELTKIFICSSIGPVVMFLVRLTNSGFWKAIREMRDADQ